MNAPSRILLVDDLAANRETLVELLAADDYRLAEAADGPTALRLAAESPPDLVLLDVNMPGMDGFEVCRRLRADPKLAEVPVILVTALDDQASRLAGLEAGADDFVSKPFNAAELRARVRTVTRLNRYRRLHEQRTQFQWIVEQAGDGYALVTADDEIHFANARARLWLGLPAEDPVNGGGRERFLAAARRSYAPRPAEAWQGWPDLAPATPAARRLLVRPETPQARAFFLDVDVLEHRGSRLLRLSDVTELFANRRDQRSFQTMVSHKLRTPLNAVLGGLELLADPAGMRPAELAEFAGMARAGAARLHAAIEDVLRHAELSRLPAPSELFALDGLDALVRSVAAGLSLPAVSVVVAADARAAGIACAPAALEWMLHELLENPKKFHPRQMPAVEVAVRLAGKDFVALTVSDDGATLSPEQLARAGAPFFQGEKLFTGETPGMGLGLASVFALVWSAGGSGRICNCADRPGVCVELQWPRRDFPHESPE